MESRFNAVPSPFPQKPPSPILICFAVKVEAKFFLPASQKDGHRLLITGMGVRNASLGIREALTEVRPSLVVTAGFAGGLNPGLKVGTVVFDEDTEAGLSPSLLKLGAVAVRFHCATRVAVTAAEKQALWSSSGADVVEMESSAIRAICREHKIPGATVRVISDAAGEDLPLDFNALMTSEDQINYLKLLGMLLAGPQKIPRLMKFQKQIVVAARELADVLSRSLAAR